MAQTKKELLEAVQSAGLQADPKATIADLKKILENMQSPEETSNETIEVEATPESEPAIAKAGKRSAKALAEAEAKEVKELRKQSGETEEVKPRIVVPPTRSRLERRSKGFKKSSELLDKTKGYTQEEALELAQKTSHVKFDATVELHINLGVDPRHADQNIRDTVLLPAGNGKTVRTAVLTDDPAAAKKAGAHIAGLDDLLAQIDKGIIDFDTLITTPAQMSKLGKYARILGPRGLMPNPKSGTVTNDIAKAVADASSGKVEYRVDSTGIVHLGIGKVSFTKQQLVDNLAAVIASIKSNKPQNIKGNYIKSIYISTTMGPSVTLDLTTIV